jgi:putative serine protease PepD
VSIDNENRQFTFAYELPAAQVQPKPKKPKTTLVIAAAVVAGAIAGGVSAATFSAIGQTSTVVVNNTESVNWVTGVAAKALPSVVTVSVGSASAGGSGSGVVLTKDGYILTNAHVVTLDGATNKVSIEVKTSAGVVSQATVVGVDPTNDLAVIKAPGVFTPMEFADSSKVNVGDNVVAIGAPLGLEESVTTGILSALNRTIQVASSAVPDGSLQLWNGSGAAPVSLRVLQTDAAINPGNSGGALLNNKGQLIGINVAIATASSTTTSGQSGSIGVGFSIPSNIAKRIADELMTSGKASHALLGALVSDAVSSSSSAAFSDGAKIEKLTPGGAAEKGGLKVGDVVTSFNGQTITSASDLTAAVRLEKANSQATIVVVRGGQEVTVNLKLGDAANAK